MATLVGYNKYLVTHFTAAITLKWLTVKYNDIVVPGPVIP